MKLSKANRKAVRSANRVNGIADLSRDDLRQVTGAAMDVCVWVNQWVDTSGELHSEVMTHRGYPSPA